MESPPAKDAMSTVDDCDTQAPDKMASGGLPEPLECAPAATEDGGSDLKCGVAGCAPSWLQRCATVHTFALLYGVFGLMDSAVNAYLLGTMTTLEKLFQLPTTTSGVILAAFEPSLLVCATVLSYVGGRGHKARWMAAGAALMAAACCSRLCLHLALGPGQRALQLTSEHGATQHLLHNTTGPRPPARVGPHLCGGPPPALDASCAPGDVTTAADAAPAVWSATLSAPALLLIASQLLMGTGTSLHFALGLAYLDDNAPKHQTALLIAASQFVRMLGPTIGYLLSSYSLSHYVAPGLTPVIDNTDPRWIGAWWIGWAPLTLLTLTVAALLSLYPRELPATGRRSPQPQQPLPQRSLADFWRSTKRLLGNRIVMCNTFSSVLYMFGETGSWAFMPKYMELHFQQTAAMTSLVLGSYGLVSAALGFLASGVVIWRFRPRPRALAAWNVAAELIGAFSRLAWIFIGCVDDNVHGTWTADGRWDMVSDCNSACSCEPLVEFSPVCAEDGSGRTFYSPCHAGCTDSYLINGTTMLGHCSCLPAPGLAVPGPCTSDCGGVLALFLVMQNFLTFIGASGHAGNALLHFRCVDKHDKSLAIGIAETLMSLLAFIPAPIIFGMIIDSTCLVWSETCGSRGNCWLYDTMRMRRVPNLIAAGFLFLGTFLDVAVWYYAKDVKLYDEEEEVAGGDGKEEGRGSALRGILTAALT